MLSHKLLSRLLLLSLFTSTVSGSVITKLYVPHGSSGDPQLALTSVFSLETGELITTISTGEPAGYAALNADSSELWLFSESGTLCTVVDPLSDQVVKSFDIQRNVFDVTFSRDGNYCFVVGTGVGSAADITIIECHSYSVKYPISDLVDPTSIELTPDGKYLYYTSRTAGQVGIVDIPSFKLIKTIRVGIEPVDLEMTADGKYLIVSCLGLDFGRRGGSEIDIIENATDRLYWIFDNVGAGPSSLSLSPDNTLLAVTYPFLGDTRQNNVRLFEVQIDGQLVKLTPSSSFAAGLSPENGFFSPQGSHWVGSDQAGGGIFVYDVKGDGLFEEFEQTRNLHPTQVAMVDVNIESRIEVLEREIVAMTDSTLIPNYYFQKAYLYKTAGRKNEMVAEYQKIVDTFRGTFAAVRAEMELSELCYSDKLFGKAAEYSFGALMSYRDYLRRGIEDKALSTAQLLLTLDRLATLAEQFDTEALKKVAEPYLKLSIYRPELPEFYFRLGYDLRRQRESKLATKCFDEAKNQLANLKEESAGGWLEERLALATGDVTAYYRIREKRGELVLDGQLLEWTKVDPIPLDFYNRLNYGRPLWKGPDDLSGQIFLTQADGNLLIAGTIKDDTLFRAGSEKGDFLGIYFDFRANSGSYFNRDFETGDGCFFFYIYPPDANNPKASLEATVQTPYEIASGRSEGGYSFELKLPLASFGSFQPPKDRKFGLGLELSDGDSPELPDQVKAMGFLMPRAKQGEALRTELFGVAEM